MLDWAQCTAPDDVCASRTLQRDAARPTARHRQLYRFERTERPEEQRLLDPFRSVRPHLENSILGTTRWTVHTAGYGIQLTLAKALAALPFVEVSYGRIADVNGGLFDAESFYGKTSFWSLSIGSRLNLGLPLHRMGRYGVAQDTAAPMGNHH